MRKTTATTICWARKALTPLHRLVVSRIPGDGHWVSFYQLRGLTELGTTTLTTALAELRRAHFVSHKRIPILGGALDSEHAHTYFCTLPDRARFHNAIARL